METEWLVEINQGREPSMSEGSPDTEVQTSDWGILLRQLADQDCFKEE
jgi:hypothetical protein